MRVSAKARALVISTVGLGAGVLSVAVFRSVDARLTTLALLGAAVLLTELIQVSSDESSLDPVDAHNFSFSSAVHLAAVVLLGAWPAALVAAFGVLVVDRLRGSAWSHIFYNASVFALAAVAGGYAFELFGGRPGTLDLPADFAAIVVLAVTYSAVNALLVTAILALESSTSPWPEVRQMFRAEASPRAAEAGLGMALAFGALEQPWVVVALVPLLLAVYQAQARLAMLRRETARALETFANIVDERDPYTYRHSARVAQYVSDFARGLGLPSSEAVRLRWAGRLHDLGKIAVDRNVLRKAGQLDGEEWAAMLRHPRLSARLLRRFRFAAEEAQAVEYHHERFDGSGYYGIAGRDLPLAPHFLIIADSFDAMTTDRPYRRRLTREQALAEIERNGGSQFHPAVAKAFVAFQRGLDPNLALSPAERDELRRLSPRARDRFLLLDRHLRRWPETITLGGVIASLVAVAFGQFELAIGGLALTSAGIGRRQLDRARARRLASSIRAALTARAGHEARFEALVDRVAEASQLRWAGLVSWKEHDLAGSIELERRLSAGSPTAPALTSWLIREAEAGNELLLAAGSELGSEGLHVALPLRRDSSLVGFVVLAFARSLPRHLELALRSSIDGLAPLLAQEVREVPALRARWVAAAS